MSGAEAQRTPSPKGSGQQELPHVHGQGQRPRGASLCWRSGAAAGRSNRKPDTRGGGQEEQPHVQGVVPAWVQEGLEEPSNVEGQKGGSEEIPLIQGKEQRLCIAGATVKKYPSSKVR